MELVKVWVSAEESQRTSTESKYEFSMQGNLQCEATKKLLLLGCHFQSMLKET